MAGMTTSNLTDALQAWKVRKTLEYAKPKLVTGRYANSKSVLNNGNSTGNFSKETYDNPMEEKRTLLAYLAGIFDGEGSIHINKTSSEKSLKAWQRKTPNYTLNVGVTNSHRGVLEIFVKQFGGSIYDRTAHRIYDYRIDRQMASRMLEQLLPFLVIKKERAKIVIDFQNRFEIFKGGRGITLSQEILDYREKIYQTIKSLNGSCYHQQRLSEPTSQIEMKR